MDHWISFWESKRNVFEFFSISKNLGWSPNFFFLFINEVANFLFYNRYNFIFLISNQKIALYSNYIISIIQARKIGFLFAIVIDAFKVGSSQLKTKPLTFSFNYKRKCYNIMWVNVLPL